MQSHFLQSRFPLAISLCLLTPMPPTLLMPKSARAQGATWTGNNGSAWETNSNWDAGVVPDDVTTAVSFLTGVANNLVLLNANHAVYGITFKSDGTNTPTAFTLRGGASTVLSLYAGGITNNVASATQTIDASVALYGNQSFTTVAGGTLSFTSGSNNRINLLGNALSKTLTIGGAGNTNLASTIIDSSGNRTLTKTGDGTLTLSNINNSFTGNIDINQGTLVAGASQTALGPTTSVLGSTMMANRFITVGDGTNAANLQFDTSNVFGTGNSNSAVGLVINTRGTVTNTAKTFNILPNITLNGGTLTGNNGLSATQQAFAFGNGTVMVGGTKASLINGFKTNGGFHLGGSTTFNVAKTGDIYYDLEVFGNLIDNFGSNGAGSLIKTGEGLMVLVFTKTYTGTTTISGGTLQVGLGLNSSSLGDGRGNVTINRGGTLTFDVSSSAGSANITNSGILKTINYGTVGKATITNNNGATIIFDGEPSEYLASAGSATVTNNNGAIISFLNYGAAGSATITNNSGGTITFTDDSSADSATITSNNGSAFTFTDTSTAGSATLINYTFLSFLARSTADNATIQNSGILLINQHTGGLSIGELSGSGNVALGGNTLTVGGRNTSSTISGVISGTGGLTKIGAGTLTLTGENTYTGNTTISAGTLVFANTADRTYGGSITGVGSFIKTGVGTLTLTGLGSSLGSMGIPTDFNNGTTVLTGASTTSYASMATSGGINVGRNAGDSGILTVTGTDGSGHATTLTNRPTSLGLYVGTAGTGTLNISGGGRVDTNVADNYLSYFGNSVGTLTVSGSGGALFSTFNTGGGALYVGFGGSGTLNALNGGIVTTGTGATYLSNQSGSSGTLNVNGGSLTTDRIVVGSGATPIIQLTNPTAGNGGGYALNLGGNGGSTTLTQKIINATGGAGGIRKTGTGTLTLTGASTFSGGMRLDDGLLVARGTSLGTGAVTITSGGTLAAGQAVNATQSAITTGAQTLSISSLITVAAAGNTTPFLTFNLFDGGVSDTLNLTGAGTTFSFSSAGGSKFIVAFASGSANNLEFGTIYNLISFSNPNSSSTMGFDTSNANNSFSARGTGNLSTTGTFQWTKSGGNITGLQYVVVSGSEMPEPGSVALLIIGLLPLVGAGVLKREKRAGRSRDLA